MAQCLSTILTDLRRSGWTVAVHNDYRKNGKLYTFWLFTHKNGRWLKAEGRDDTIAVQSIAKRVGIEP